jgi:hypothetical protein
MSFYASHDFLEAAASVYFKGRAATIEDVRIDEDVLRLLVIDGRHVVTRLLFLDFHQPVSGFEKNPPLRKGRYAQRVCRGVIEADTWDSNRFEGQELAPFISWSRFAKFGDYYDHILARHHGLVRDRERRGRALAAKHGDLVFTVDDRADDVLPLTRQWKGDQLREMGFPDYFENPKTMTFLKTLQERGLLVSSTLRAGGKLVSAWIGFIHEGVWSGWVFSYNPALRKYSAGHQLLIRMLEESFRLGHREFDFSVGAPDYKMLYATQGRLLGSIGTPSLKRAVTLFARDMLREYSPSLFATALRAKSAFVASTKWSPISPTAILERGL